MTGPKILFLDIETFPLIGDMWGMWKTNVLAVREYTRICGFSAKWYNGPQITKILPDYEGYNNTVWDDYLLVLELHSLLDNADIVVAHNGDQFDVKTINARFILHGLKPPAPYQTVDTKKVAKKVFRFASNSLNNVCDFLALGRKFTTGGYELWQKCMAGDRAAWAKMKRYNANDVKLLEKLYLKLLPWNPDQPNARMFNPDAECPKCGKGPLQKRGFHIAKTRSYQRYQCKSCHGWSRKVKSATSSPIVGGI
jgi:hypothetical protein